MQESDDTAKEQEGDVQGLSMENPTSAAELQIKLVQDVSAEVSERERARTRRRAVEALPAYLVAISVLVALGSSVVDMLGAGIVTMSGAAFLITGAIVVLIVASAVVLWHQTRLKRRNRTAFDLSQIEDPTLKRMFRMLSIHQLGFSSKLDPTGRYPS